jgi:hypothetical protein
MNRHLAVEPRRYVMPILLALFALVLVLGAAPAPAAAAAGCGDRGVAVQVLGSGGPVADDLLCVAIPRG